MRKCAYVLLGILTVLISKSITLNLFTLLFFFFAGYNVYVVQDATRGVEEGTTVSAVREMKDQGQLRSGHAP